MDPDRFGDYEVVGLLGAGAFARAFEVKAAGTDEPLALKWLREDPEAHGPERFQNEAWALGQLDHPAIPKLVDQGSLGDRPYIVMTLARGETLSAICDTQAAERGTMSELRVLAILEAILEALAHMHSRHILHRDVKHDNIIANPSESQVTLVDLGMCTGPGQPVDAATFWNAGASRFSPPSKLHYPGRPHPTHDVFAVGVLGYLLLTNEFPWSVQLNEDRGDLEDLMRQRPAPPVAHVNSLVTRNLADFIHRLLTIDDDTRPTAEEALRDVRQVRDEIAGGLAPPVIAGGSSIRLPRVIRDPLHGDIPMTEFEWRLIGTGAFQRLRWIRQLGPTNLVYPGAEHSRFAHSLGTMHVADEILRRMGERLGEPFEPEERLMARTYALLHDVTHIAYGHALEDELGFFKRHDLNEGRIERVVLDDGSGLSELLRSTSYGRLVLAHFDDASIVPKHSWLRELIQCPAGADVLDYVGRDSLHCGLDHKVDSAILRWFTIGKRDVQDPQRQHLKAQLHGRSGFRIDAEFALESILRERLGLFMKVYTHPQKIIAGSMIGKAVWQAIRTQGGQGLDECMLERMGDNELLYFLRDSADPSVSRLAKGVLERRLYQVAFRARALEAGQWDLEHYELRRSRLEGEGLFDPEARASLEDDIARKAGLQPGDVIIYSPPKAPGLQRVRQYVETQPGLEQLRDEVHDSYARVFSSHLRLWSVYVFIAPSLEQNIRNTVVEQAEGAIGLKNEMDFDRRQTTLEF